jgi:hypothetical protein
MRYILGRGGVYKLDDAGCQGNRHSASAPTLSMEKYENAYENIENDDSGRGTAAADSAGRRRSAMRSARKLHKADARVGQTAPVASAPANVSPHSASPARAVALL